MFRSPLKPAFTATRRLAIAALLVVAQAGHVEAQFAPPPPVRDTIPRGTWEFAGLTDPLGGRLFPAGGYFLADNWSIVTTFGTFHSKASRPDTVTVLDSVQLTFGSFYTITTRHAVAPILGGEFVFGRHNKAGDIANVTAVHLIPGFRVFVSDRSAVLVLAVVGFGRVEGGAFGDDNGPPQDLHTRALLMGYSFFF